MVHAGRGGTEAGAGGPTHIVSAARKQGEKCLVLSLLLTFFPRGQGTTLPTVGIGPPTPVDPIQKLLTDTSLGLFSRLLSICHDDCHY